MTTINKDELLNRLQAMDKMPTLPVALAPLLRYLEQPIENLEVQEVVDLISRDKSLAAQCLQLANSPLFGLWRNVDSVRGAVVALGMQRMRDIAVSCSVLKLTPNGKTQLDPTVFWEHSLGCALVCRRFAHKIGFPDPGKAYLAGLLHDIGIIGSFLRNSGALSIWPVRNTSHCTRRNSANWELRTVIAAALSQRNGTWPRIWPKRQVAIIFRRTQRATALW
jgi:HD-like signal output (HDOD) protein